MATRRNVLTLLGLASVSSAAMATDDLVSTETAPYRLAIVDPERFAVAFERLAAAVRADEVNISKFLISSEIMTDDVLKQTLTIDLEVMHQAEVS